MTRATSRRPIGDRRLANRLLSTLLEGEGRHLYGGAVIQRLPALGRRPWFALLRRARCLRRAFFAMKTDRVVRAEVEGHRWASPPLVVARSRLRRWRGLRPRPSGRGLLLAGSSVHGRGMQEPLRLIGVSDAGHVVSSVVLLPGTFRQLEGARYIVELPLEASAPALGSTLHLFPIVTG